MLPQGMHMVWLRRNLIAYWILRKMILYLKSIEKRMLISKWARQDSPVSWKKIPGIYETERLIIECFTSYTSQDQTAFLVKSMLISVACVLLLLR